MWQNVWKNGTLNQLNTHFTMQIYNFFLITVSFSRIFIAVWEIKTALSSQTMRFEKINNIIQKYRRQG